MPLHKVTESGTMLDPKSLEEKPPPIPSPCANSGRKPMTSLPTLPPIISAGNLLTIATVIVTAGIGWGQLTSKISSEEAMRATLVEQVNIKLDADNASRNAIEQRVRVLEEKAARIDERFTMLISLMTDLKHDVSMLAQTPTVVK